MFPLRNPKVLSGHNYFIHYKMTSYSLEIGERRVGGCEQRKGKKWRSSFYILRTFTVLRKIVILSINAFSIGDFFYIYKFNLSGRPKEIIVN